MNVLAIVVQLVLGLLVLALVRYIINSAFHTQNVTRDYTKQIVTPVFTGWVNTSNFVNRMYNSFNPLSKTYRDMPRSVNMVGGAQFSFTVWTRFNDTSAENLKNKVLFLFGDPTKYTVTKTINDKHTEVSKDYVIKCPVVRFSDDAESLLVQFNTNENIGNTLVIPKVKTLDEANRHNVMSLMPEKWSLWSFVFVDNTKNDSLVPGVEVKVYINEFLYYSQSFAGSLRLNKGFVNVMPVDIKSGYLADLTYYNWAISHHDVMRVVKAGPSTSPYNDLDNDASAMSPNYLTEYNKMEIYNM
jgi:hypothetical protein